MARPKGLRLHSSTGSWRMLIRKRYKSYSASHVTMMIMLILVQKNEVLIITTGDGKNGTTVEPAIAGVVTAAALAKTTVACRPIKTHGKKATALLTMKIVVHKQVQHAPIA
eukprot:TRINITY_DN3645_c0_g1_i4.p2 TRINITY_DN3645_c0_g1~~TRINITY_DN3645_c0_g1_i4.p2  ORF type:complete len:111 (-),score=7.75 TRINITY_DN3645_c0_g1_i4:726-1058(-)